MRTDAQACIRPSKDRPVGLHYRRWEGLSRALYCYDRLEMVRVYRTVLDCVGACSLLVVQMVAGVFRSSQVCTCTQKGVPSAVSSGLTQDIFCSCDVRCVVRMAILGVESPMVSCGSEVYVHRAMRVVGCGFSSISSLTRARIGVFKSTNDRLL
jgi:hypothetical protein